MILIFSCLILGPHIYYNLLSLVNNFSKSLVPKNAVTMKHSNTLTLDHLSSILSLLEIIMQSLQYLSRSNILVILLSNVRFLLYCFYLLL